MWTLENWIIDKILIQKKNSQMMDIIFNLQVNKKSIIKKAYVPPQWEVTLLEMEQGLATGSLIQLGKATRKIHKT